MKDRSGTESTGEINTEMICTTCLLVSLIIKCIYTMYKAGSMNEGDL